MLLKIHNLTFSYGSHQILKDISLSLYPNQSLSIVGISGSGKSTLLNIVSGIIKNNCSIKGKISYNEGENLFDLKSKGKISYMFQSTTLLPNLTTIENLVFPLKILKGKNLDINVVNDFIKMIGLSDFQDYYPRELSGGMKSRLELARTFITEPSLILLDEPFSSLDLSWKYELYNKYFILKEKFSASSIIVTHDIQEAVILSDLVIVLNKNGTLASKYEVVKKHNISDPEGFSLFLSDNQQIIYSIQNEILSN